MTKSFEGSAVMHRVGRVAAALSMLALLHWSALSAADTPSGGSPGIVGNGKTITLGDDSGKGGSSTKLVPPSHTVKKGDTLWDICDEYFGNPWQWPRVWSYNPELLNPHWIYPGEIIRLKKEGGITPSGGNGSGAPSGTLSAKGPVVLKPKLVPNGTVFLQNSGFIYDSDVEDTGEITGSPEDKMMLTTLDRVYLRVTANQAKDLAPGDTMTVFQNTRPVKTPDGKSIGTVVQILGTVKIQTIDKDTHLATGEIIDARDVIERGAHVGPVERRFDVVPPATNQNEITGHVLASIHANEMFGANQVVLIDRGEKDGLKPGNRLLVVRKGDPWQQGLSSAGAYTAGKVSLDPSGPADVSPQQGKQSDDYPNEVIAEIQVVRVRKETATCLVKRSRTEIIAGDLWQAKKGY